MVIAVDFDGVIHDPYNVKPGKKMGAPINGAVESMRKLALGNTLVIHTIWASDPQKVRAISNWLDYFDIPYHNVTNKKPDADVYIDDKALKFVSWDKTLEELGF